VPDHLDDCPYVANADQTDTDGDGVGDACDQETCGNALIEAAEDCDGTNAPTCPGTCGSDCTCCENFVTNPKINVTVTTKKEAGKLSAHVTIQPFTSYAGQPIEVRLDDGDTRPIARRRVAVLAPSGNSGLKWQFKAKGDGLQRIVLKDASKRVGGTPGTGAYFDVVIKAKRWFSAAAANQPAGTTRLTVKFGDQCFTAWATKKKD
jgi:hypothetical protein